MAPKERKSTDCYFPPEGCNYPTIEPTVGWRTAVVLDKADKKAGGLKIDWPASADAPFSQEPFQRSSLLPRIHATGSTLVDKTWPTVSCTSMEKGCKKCAGPLPNVTSIDVTHSITLIPFGATDIRIAILPAVWSKE